MRDDEGHEENAGHPSVFPVGPVRTRHMVPREMLVAVVVGALAFLAGIQVAAGGTPDRARPSLPPPSPPVPAATIVATPGPLAEPPGSSLFVGAFQPSELIAGLPGGAGCVTSSRQTEAPRTRRDGPILTFARSWTTYCPIPPDRRQAFLLRVLEGLIRQVPADTYSYSATTRGPGDALFPYSERPFAGTVALTADEAGPGFEIAILLEEWRLD